MNKTEHPYAQVLRWIADGEAVEVCGSLPNDFQVFPAEEILRGIANGVQPATYRLKPRTISINGHEVPEPMRVAPQIGSRFFLALTAQCILAGEHTWQGSHASIEWLAKGLCHVTREAAEAHAKALLSFTTTEAP